jgi:hypothetical protein
MCAPRRRTRSIWPLVIVLSALVLYAGYSLVVAAAASLSEAMASVTTLFYAAILVLMALVLTAMAFLDSPLEYALYFLQHILG